MLTSTLRSCLKLNSFFSRMISTRVPLPGWLAKLQKQARKAKRGPAKRVRPVKKAAEKDADAGAKVAVEEVTEPVAMDDVGDADLVDPVLSVATVTLAHEELSPVFPPSVVRQG